MRELGSQREREPLSQSYRHPKSHGKGVHELLELEEFERVREKNQGAKEIGD